MKNLFLVTFVAICILFFSGCDNKQSSKDTSVKIEKQETTKEPVKTKVKDSAKAGIINKIKERGKIKIGVFSDKPPFGFIDKDGKNQGYDIYFAKRIAKDLLGDENKVEFVLVEAANRVEFIKSDKVDIILANFTKTPERAEQVLFGLPYMKVALGVVSPENDVIADVEQLRGKKLIVNKGTTADAYFTKNHPEIDLLKYDQNTETFSALLDKRGVALSHDNTLLFAWAASNPGYKVGIQELGNKDVIAPAVKFGNEELLEWINNEIIELGKENFFHKNYDETLKPIYGDMVDPESVVAEGGKL